MSVDRMAKVQPDVKLAPLTDEQVERVRALPDMARQREAVPAVVTTPPVT